jgi:hypothetical protein
MFAQRSIPWKYHENTIDWKAFSIHGTFMGFKNAICRYHPSGAWPLKTMVFSWYLKIYTQVSSLKGCGFVIKWIL